MVSRAGRFVRYDSPDGRRLHIRQKPRGGGLGLLLSVPPAVLLAGQGPDIEIRWWLFGLALPNGFLGLADDFRPLPPAFKLAVQFVFALFYTSYRPMAESPDVLPFATLIVNWTVSLVTAVWIVWLTNMFNFMDGMDLLAGVSGVMFLIGFALLATTASIAFPTLSGACLIAASGLIGFLFLNRPPARIFMGDGGALFIGAFLAGASVLLWRESRVSFVAPLLVIGIFMFDTSYTLVRRFVAGEPVLQAHCSHLYQRLARSGLSHTRVRLLYFGLNALSGCSALLFVNVNLWIRALLALFVTCGCASLLFITHRMERRALSALPGAQLTNWRPPTPMSFDKGEPLKL